MGSKRRGDAHHLGWLRAYVDTNLFTSLIGEIAVQLGGECRLPRISDTALAPLIAAFRRAVPDGGVKAFISGRIGDDVAHGIDLEVKIGRPRGSDLVRQRLISYRHRLVASPGYLRAAKALRSPRDLLDHPLLAFAFRSVEHSWTLTEVGGYDQEVLHFHPHLSIGDYAGLTSLMLADGGIGDLPLVVQPDLLRDGRLVEVLPGWTLPVFDLSLVHLSARSLPASMRAFKDFAGDVVPRLLPDLPT